jgi:hypothetical protein
VVPVEEHIPQTTKEWSLWRSKYRKLQRRGLCGGAHTANYKGVVPVEEHIPQTTKDVNINITQLEAEMLPKNRKYQMSSTA